LGALPTSPLVGREPELRRLLSARDATAAGQGRLVLLAGEPGVGKTRLAQELMLRAREHGFQVLAGRCYEQHASLPFFPFVEALISAIDLASPTLRQEIPRRFPYLGRLLPDLIESPPAREGEDARLRIWHAVGGFLAALAAEAPVALLLDDLHWADSASLELLPHLARRVTGDRILLLGTYRDVEVNRLHPLEAALTELVRERLMEEVILRGLSPAGTAALIGAHFGLEEVSTELRDLLHARTEGNPFFLEEVLKVLVEQEAIFRSGERWDRKAIGEIDVPRSVRAVVGQRVGRLVPEAQEILRTASVLGQEWDLEALIDVAGRDEAAVLDCLDAAFTARLLEERGQGRRERYAFAHALIGQALYAEVPRHRLRRLHLRAGEALEQLGAGRAEAWAELARHFLAAGEEQRAIRYSLLAGDHAAGLYAHAEAIQHYEAALELLAEADGGLGVAQVQVKLGGVLSLAGRYDEALAALDRAAESYRSAGNLTGLGRVTARIGWVHSYRGTGEEGLTRIQPMLELVEAGGRSPELVELYGALAILLFVTGRYRECYTASRRAVDLARSVGDDRLLAVAQMQLANALRTAGPVEVAGRVAETARLLEAATQRAEAAGDLETLYHCVHTAALIRLERGEFAAARPVCERVMLLAEQLGDPSWISWAIGRRGWLSFLEGDWDQARTDLDRALALTGQVRIAWTAAYALNFRGMLHLLEGQWGQANRLLQEAGTRAGQGDLQALRMAARPLAELDLLQGDPMAARARLLPLLDRSGLEEYPVTALLPVLAWAHLELGDVEQAVQVVGEALRRARSEELRLVLVEALRVQAMLEVRLEQWEEAERALNEGISLARSMPYPYAEARLLHLYGRRHAHPANAETAREHLTAALAVFQRLGAHKDIERVEQDLARLHEQPEA
jgi:tetratricopeptide (TPR) repeat protein